MIKGCRINTRPESEDYVVTVDSGKKYKARSLKACFKAANGRMPKGDKEMDRFLKKVAYGG